MRFPALPRRPAARTAYVSLDRAGTIIEGGSGPFLLTALPREWKGTVVRYQARDDETDDDFHYLPGGVPLSTKAPAPAKNSATAVPEVVGGGDFTDLHMKNFIECVCSRKAPNCSFEIGFRSAIAARMMLTSYRHGWKVRWDPESQEII